MSKSVKKQLKKEHGQRLGDKDTEVLWKWVKDCASGTRRNSWTCCPRSGARKWPSGRRRRGNVSAVLWLDVARDGRRPAPASRSR